MESDRHTGPRGAHGAGAVGRVAVASALAACLLVPALTSTGLATASAAGRCLAPTSILSRTPTLTPLPGGASMRVWDTGVVPGRPLASVRVVAVSIPPAARLKGAVYTSGSLSRHRTAAQQGAGHPKAVVIVNGGVFMTSSPGVQVEQTWNASGVSKLTSTLSSVAGVLANGRIGVTQIHVVGRVSIAGGRTAITGVNWQSLRSGGVNLYTPGFGSARHPRGTVEVLVKAGKVIAVRRATDRGLPVPLGAVALTGTGSAATALARATVGRAVGLSYRVVTNWWGTSTAVAARTVAISAGLDVGASIVLKGVVQRGSCDARSEQLRPRTAIGWKADGTELVVTVSGRAVVNGVQFGGATDAQLAAYLKALGAVHASKLDGGGSTTMLVRTRVGGPLVRVDRKSSDPQRPIVNTFAFELP